MKRRKLARRKEEKTFHAVWKKDENEINYNDTQIHRYEKWEEEKIKTNKDDVVNLKKKGQEEKKLCKIMGIQYYFYFFTFCFLGIQWCVS